MGATGNTCILHLGLGTQRTLDLVTPDGTEGSDDSMTRMSQLQPKTIKRRLEVWLKRVAGKFECELDSRLASGRAISMANQAHLLRDRVEDRPVVFRMACLWVDALPEACKLELARSAVQARLSFLRQATARPLPLHPCKLKWLPRR